MEWFRSIEKRKYEKEINRKDINRPPKIGRRRRKGHQPTKEKRTKYNHTKNSADNPGGHVGLHKIGKRSSEGGINKKRCISHPFAEV